MVHQESVEVPQTFRAQPGLLPSRFVGKRKSSPKKMLCALYFKMDAVGKAQWKHPDF
jgi:hypothetical protein